MVISCSASVLILGELLTRHINKETMIDIGISLIVVTGVRFINSLIQKYNKEVFNHVLATVVMITQLLVNLFIFLKFLVPSVSVVVPVDLTEAAGDSFKSPLNIFSVAYLRVVITEIIYSVAFTLLDGILEKVIKIKRGEESIEGLFSDFKLQVSG
jgi:hypothetical protein